ncbi:MAG: competence/damage-inducible protein A [Nitrospirae bacterium]|nr:competence/damage-inducible protein A [Nitrospirota bacterium]
MRRGEIIAIGSELLLGGRVDTNSLFLTDELAALGIEVRWKTVVGDDEADIAAAVRVAARRADFVVMTGGLGPTGDDLTREAVARVTNRPLRRHADAVKGMTQRLAVWGRTPTAAQMKQALIPSGAAVLNNPVGSAPGFCLSWKTCQLIALPGVPAEAEAMFTKEATRFVAEPIQARARTLIERRVLHTFGILEAELDARLGPLVTPCRGVRLGLLASPLGVTVSLTVCGGASEIAALDQATHAVRHDLGGLVYAEGAATMEEVVGRALAARKMTIAVAESCTGGLIGHRLTQVPGSSAYLDRVLVCYSNEAKMELLDVSKVTLARHGAVSPEVAAAMAQGVREHSKADVGLSVTGIAGPGGNTAQKPIGLVYVGFDAKGTGVLTREFRFHGSRDTIKLRASQAALNVLRQWLPVVQPK